MDRGDAQGEARVSDDDDNVIDLQRLLGPQPLALTGTWAPDCIDLRDRLPADGAKARSPATSAAS